MTEEQKLMAAFRVGWVEGLRQGVNSIPQLIDSMESLHRGEYITYEDLKKELAKDEAG